MRGTKEIIEIMDAFEMSCKTDYAGYIGCKIERIERNGKHDREWPKDHFYTNTELNTKFKFFMMGYMSGRSHYMH